MKYSKKLKSATVKMLCLCTIVSLSVFTSCEEDSLVDEQDNFELKSKKSQKCEAPFKGHKLVDFQLVVSLTSDQIKGLVPATFASLVNYDVNLYKVSYYSRYKGKRILVSGAVGVPVLSENIIPKIAMYNHGTRITEADNVPSLGNDLISVLTAAYGNISFAPDYIGFGDSKQEEHPYLINEASTPIVCDMILAGNEFLKRNHIKHKKGLYMFGFSQGGLVTIAAQKEIERNHHYRGKIKLNAVATATGPYDLYESAVYSVIEKESYPAPAFLLFAFTSYNSYYNLGYNASDMFQDSIAETYFRMVEQGKTYNEINAALPVKIADLLKGDFRENFLKENTMFNYYFQQNSIIEGWTPKTSLRLFHSPNDEIVPYANAENAYNTFIESGSVSNELITLPPVDHVTSAFISYVEILGWIDSFN